MESAIPEHLQTARTRHRRVGDDYAPPYPSFVARHKPSVTRVVMAYFGLQTRGAPPVDESRETPYRYLFEHAAEALAMVDAGNMITRVNHKFAQLAGMDRSAIEGQRRIEEFILPGHKVQLATGSGQTRALLASSLSSFILTFRRADGAETQVEAAFNLLSDSQYLVQRPCLRQPRSARGGPEHCRARGRVAGCPTPHGFAPGWSTAAGVDRRRV